MKLEDLKVGMKVKYFIDGIKEDDGQGSEEGVAEITALLPAIYPYPIKTDAAEGCDLLRLSEVIEVIS